MNIRIVPITLVIAATLTGCATTPSAMPIPNSGKSHAVFDLYRGTSFDYDLVSDPDMLAAGSKLVVEGVIQDAFWGRTWGIKGDQVADWKSITLAVRVDKVYAGDQTFASKTVYLEQQVSAGVTPGEFKKALIGAKAALFLIQAVGPDKASLVQDPLGGRPAGEPLWVSGPQGFAVSEPSSSEVIWPMLQDSETGQLSDALPGGSLAPTE
jgi:hypothetical protein